MNQSPNNTGAHHQLIRFTGRSKLENKWNLEINNNLQELAALLPYKGRSKAILSIDFHQEPFFEQPLFQAKEQAEHQVTIIDRGMQVISYATLAIVSLAGKLEQPITLGMTLNYKGRSRHDVVATLLQDFQARYNYRISYLLFDGGFMTHKVVKFLDSEHIPFIGRGLYSKKANYPNSAVFSHSVAGTPVFAYHLRLKLPTGEYRPYFLYSSSQQVALSCQEVKRIYRFRFRIENTYRHSRKFKIRTTSRNINLYLYFWGFAQFLECLWELLRLVCILLAGHLKFVKQDWICDLFLNLLADLW